MSVSLSDITLPLNKIPLVDDSLLYEALLDVHNSILKLLAEYNIEYKRLHAVSDIQSTDYYIADTDRLVLGETATAGANITFYLPDPTLVPGKDYIIKQTTGGFNIVLTGVGGELIDGAASQNIAVLGSLHIMNDGSDWWII